MKLRSLNNKQGITISTPTIVITILAVLVLLVVALSFTGGMRNLIDKIRQVQGSTIESPEELARDKCETLCVLQREKSYCEGVTINVDGVDKNFACSGCEGITCE